MFFFEFQQSNATFNAPNMVLLFLLISLRVLVEEVCSTPGEARVYPQPTVSSSDKGAVRQGYALARMVRVNVGLIPAAAVVLAQSISALELTAFARPRSRELTPPQC